MELITTGEEIGKQIFHTVDGALCIRSSQLKLVPSFVLFLKVGEILF